LSKRNLISITVILLICIIAILLIYASSKKTEKLSTSEIQYQSQSFPSNITRKEDISTRNQQIYDYLQSRWDFYEKRNGIYIPEEHDDIVLSETANKFDITKDEVFKIFDKIEKIRLGIKPKEKISLDVENISVNIIIQKINLLPNNILEITIENKTKKPITLPIINLTFDLYQGTTNVGHQIVWIENLGYMEIKTYKSLSIRHNFDTIQATGYMNIDKMKAMKLKSIIQASNDPGETVIPIFRFPRRDLIYGKRKIKEQKKVLPQRIKGSIAGRGILRSIEPEYPAWAEASGMKGEVELKFWVTPAGEVSEVEVWKTSGWSGFDISAADVLMRWRFEPIEERERQWGIISFVFEFEKVK